MTRKDLYFLRKSTYIFFFNQHEYNVSVETEVNHNVFPRFSRWILCMAQRLDFVFWLPSCDVCFYTLGVRNNVNFCNGILYGANLKGWSQRWSSWPVSLRYWSFEQPILFKLASTSVYTALPAFDLFFSYCFFLVHLALHKCIFFTSLTSSVH